MEEGSKPERYDDISETAPLRGNDSDEDQEAERLFMSGCGCFRWRRWRQTGSTLNHPPPQEEKKEEEGKRGCIIWFREKAKKMKQLSEILAGPRWKNFIRRNSNAYHNGGDNSKKKKKKKTTTSNFQYDPRSYALNFDDGIDKEDHGIYLNFSGRYVVPMKP